MRYQSLLQFLLRHLSFARAPKPHRIDESKERVQFGILFGRGRRAEIERFDLASPNLPVRIGPDGRQVVTLCDFSQGCICKHRRSPRGRHSTGHIFGPCGIDNGQTVNNELKQPSASDVVRFYVIELRLHQSAYRRMNFRHTHPEVLPQNGITGPTLREGKLKSYNHILLFQSAIT